MGIITGPPLRLQGVVFFLLLHYANTVLTLPFTLYSTFRIENRYGSNTKTPRLWLADLMKSTALTTVLYGLALSAGFWIVSFSPDHWWLFVWAFFFVFSLQPFGAAASWVMQSVPRPESVVPAHLAAATPPVFDALDRDSSGA